MKSDLRVYQLYPHRSTRGRYYFWGPLFDEAKAQGWTAVQKTCVRGKRVWVMEYTGRAQDAPVKWARALTQDNSRFGMRSKPAGRLPA